MELSQAKLRAQISSVNRRNQSWVVWDELRGTYTITDSVHHYKPQHTVCVYRDGHLHMVFNEKEFNSD